MQRANPRHPGPRPRRCVRLALAVALGVTLAVGSSAPAAARGGKGAVAVKSKRALGHFLKGEFEQAAALYLQAHQASKAPKYLYNIGLCYYKLGRYGPALKLLRRFQRVAGKTVAPAYLGGAAKKIAEILRITKLVRLDVDPAGARLVLDGRPPVTAPIPGRVRLRNGQHTLLVTYAGHLTVQRTFRVGPGQSDTVKVRLRPWTDPRRRAGPERRRAGPEHRRTTRSIETPQTGPRRRRTAVWLAIAVTGTALAVVGEGLAWGLWAAHAGGDQTDNKAYGYLYYSGHVVAVVGAALAVAGFVLHFRKPAERADRAERAEPRARIRWMPVVTAGPRGAYAGLGGTF